MAETIALVGGETLLGRELREVLGETALGQHLRLVAAAEEESGTLTEIGGNPAFLAKLDPDRPKLVAFESVYSMDGDIAPIAELCDVAETHAR